MKDIKMISAKIVKGSEKQIKWANDIQAKMAKQCEEFVVKVAEMGGGIENVSAELITDLENRVLGSEDAEFYINNRYASVENILLGKTCTLEEMLGK